MADDQQEAPLTEEELRIAINGRSTDWFLQQLVATVNRSPVEFGITLYVEGTVVSGMLVSGKKYFDTFAKEFSDAYPGDDEVKEIVRGAFASNSDIYKYDDADGEPPPPQYIHLINARCFAPGGQPLPGNRGVLWRGKINAVSGFSLGSLEA